MNPKKDKVLALAFTVTTTAAVATWVYHYSWYQSFFWENIALPPKDLEDPIYSMVGNAASFFGLPLLIAILLGAIAYAVVQKFYNPQK